MLDWYQVIDPLEKYAKFQDHALIRHFDLEGNAKHYHYVPLVGQQDE